MKGYKKPIIDVDLIDIKDILSISNIQDANGFDDWNLGDGEDFSHWGKN